MFIRPPVAMVATGGLKRRLNMEEKALIDCSRLLTDEEIEAVGGGSLLNDIKTVAGDIWR